MAELKKSSVLDAGKMLWDFSDKISKYSNAFFGNEKLQ